MTTTIAHHFEERQAHAKFVCEHAEPEYRVPLADLFTFWHQTNEEYFDGRLMEPHLEFGRAANCSLGHCDRTTNYGGRLLITLNKSLVIEPTEKWVRNPWPSDGLRSFMEDLILRFTVRQYVLEVLEHEERGYRGYGPLFQKEANRIGTFLGLHPVSVRRRPGHEDDGPPCIGWPHCVRSLSDYGEDITEALYLLAAGTRGVKHSTVQNLGILELVQYLLLRERANDAKMVIERHLAWLERFSSRRFPVRRRAEEGREDVDGSFLEPVVLDPSWLHWNGGTVNKIAHSIRAFRSFGDLPILADALEEAGCIDERILRHLRAEMVHDSRCWVLRLLLAIGD